MIYLFDTNILLALIKKNQVANKVNSILSLTDGNQIYISTVTIGEALSIAKRNGWGTVKRRELDELFSAFFQLSVDGYALFDLYATIDTFSQNKLPERPLGSTARNMGKNDLWIAASLVKASLITTDKDFDHLHGEFVEVIRIDPAVN